MSGSEFERENIVTETLSATAASKPDDMSNQEVAREHDWRKRKQQVDALAAALILQDFLDHRPRP